MTLPAAVATHGSGHGLFWGPSKFQALVQARAWNAPDAGRFANGAGTSKRGDLVGAVGVLHLFMRRRPSAILGRIWSVVVDALDLRAFGTWTHVPQELFEAVNPRLAHTNATSTIAFVALTVRVLTALFHGLPQCVVGMVRQAVRRLRASLTSTALVGLQPRSLCDKEGAAVAVAMPREQVVHLGCWAKHRDHPKSLSRQIQRFRHRAIMPQPVTIGKIVMADKPLVF